MTLGEIMMMDVGPYKSKNRYKNMITLLEMRRPSKREFTCVSVTALLL